MPDPQLPPTSEASALRAPSPQLPQAKDQSPAKPAADMSLRPHSIPPTQHTALAVPDSLRTTEARPRTAFFPNITWKRPADTSQTAGSRPHDNPPTQARKLLDLFAGKSTPISAAASLQSIPRWEPIDIAINAQHDILQDAFFHRLLVGFYRPPGGRTSVSRLLHPQTGARGPTPLPISRAHGRPTVQLAQTPASSP